MDECGEPSEQSAAHQPANEPLGARWQRSRMALGAAVGLLACLVLAPTVSAAEPPSYNMQGTWTTGYLEGSTHQAANGSYDITSMDMATGTLSGSAETGGISFALAGTESGSVAHITLKEGSYTAYDTLHLSTLGSGHVGGNGTFNSIEFNETGAGFWAEQNQLPGEETSKKAKEEAEKKAKEEAEKTAKRPTATTVTCNYEFATSENTCVAAVGDAGAGTPVTPTGTVTFTSTSGAFSGASCSLAPTSGSPSVGSCTLVYQTANSGLPEITASYSGDARHTASSGRTQFLGMGSGEGTEEAPPGAPGQYPNEITLGLEVPTNGTTVEGSAEGSNPSPAPLPLTLPGLAGLDTVSATDLKLTETDAKKVDASGGQNANSVKEMDQSIEKLNQRAVELTHAPAPAQQAEGQVLTKDTNETLESITKMLKAQQEAEKEIIKNAKSSAFSSTRHKTAKKQKTRAVKPLAHVIERNVATGKLKLVLKLNRAALTKLAGKHGRLTVYVRVTMVLPSMLYKSGLPRSYVKTITLKRTPMAKGHNPHRKR
jgi:hypothetical protein